MARRSGLFDDNNISSINERSNNFAAGKEVIIDAGSIKSDVPEKTASFGDRIFLDDNGNGIQDPGEMSVGGVPIIVEDRNGIV